MDMHKVSFTSMLEWKHSLLLTIYFMLDLMESVASESINFIDNVKQMTPDDRVLALKKIGTLLSDSLKRGEEKVSLAKTTFDTV
jgi:hypothetical protein